MDSYINFFYILIDAFQEDNHFKIWQLLFETNGQKVIKVSFRKSWKMRLYRIVYDQNSLVVTINRSWLFYSKLIATIKIDVENDSTIQAAVKNIRDILLK